jgi:hypothetical protein
MGGGGGHLQSEDVGVQRATVLLAAQVCWPAAMTGQRGRVGGVFGGLKDVGVQ